MRGHGKSFRFVMVIKVSTLMLDFRLYYKVTVIKTIIQSEVNQKEKHKYSILTHIYGI